MDIHKPKPVHSWREFLNEIAIIIIGVLIALGLEQAVESWHHAEQVKQARENLREELSFNLLSWQYTLNNAACAQANLAVLMNRIEKRDVAGVKAMVAGEDWQKLGIGFRASSQTAWETVNSSGLMAHMASKERLDYANAYLAMEVEYNGRRETSNAGYALISAARVFDGSVEEQRDLLRQASAVSYYFERRPTVYRLRMAELAKSLGLHPAKPWQNEPKASWTCVPIQSPTA